MPLYEYYCTDCHQITEALRTISQADSPIECQHCHSPHTTRALSRFAAFSKSDGGNSHAISGTGGGCAGCSGSSCAGCGSH